MNQRSAAWGADEHSQQTPSWTAFQTNDDINMSKRGTGSRGRGFRGKERGRGRGGRYGASAAGEPIWMKYKRASEERRANGSYPVFSTKDRAERKRLMSLVDKSPEELRIASDDVLELVERAVRKINPLLAEAESAVAARLQLQSVHRDRYHGVLELGQDGIKEEDMSAVVPRTLASRAESPEKEAMLAQRARLPAWKLRAEILDAVRRNQVVVIKGETGCGKTTQVPQFILDDAIESRSLLGGGKVPDVEFETNIVCTQPRRISALGVAERVAAERLEKSGETVGWQIRLEHAAAPHTRLLFCTTGILLRKLHGDPLLEGASRETRGDVGTWNHRVTHIIVDEIHERSLDSDFLLVLLRDILPRRPDLRVILMSATLSAEKFQSYFQNSATAGVDIVEIPGFTFPVTRLFLEDVIEHTHYRTDGNNYSGRREESRVNTRMRGRLTGRDAASAEEFDDAHAQILRESLESPRHRPTGYSRQTVRTVTDIFRDEGTGRVSFASSSAASRAPIDLDLVLDTVLYACNVMAPEEDFRFEHERSQHHALTPPNDRNQTLQPPKEPSGAILVFLPGWGEISELVESLEAAATREKLPLYVLPLHSQLSTQQQRKIFQPAPRGLRKVVVSTNVAETSITIDDVTFVVDGGKHKLKSYDASTNIACLLPAWISQASARQRAGRAGRVRPGICLHLFPRCLHDQFMQPYDTPELLRTPLAEVCLQIALLELGPAHDFLRRALDAPKTDAVSHALELLRRIGAMELVAVDNTTSTSSEVLTSLGQHLAKLPVHPQLGKMLLIGSVLGVGEPALTIAASLGYGRSPFVLPTNIRDRSAVDAAKAKFAGGTQSDHIALLRVYDSWVEAEKRSAADGHRFVRENWLSASALQMVKKIRAQFQMHLRTEGFEFQAFRHDNKKSGGQLEIDELALITAVVSSGLFPNVARVDAVGGHRRRSKLITGRFGRVVPHPSSANASAGQNVMQHHWLVYLEKTRSVGGLMLNDSAAVPIMPLVLFADRCWESDSHGERLDLRGAKHFEKFLRQPAEPVLRIDDWIAASVVCQRSKHAGLLLRRQLHRWLLLSWDQLRFNQKQRSRVQTQQVTSVLAEIGEHLAHAVSLAVGDAHYNSRYDQITLARRENRRRGPGRANSLPSPIIPSGALVETRPDEFSDDVSSEGASDSGNGSNVSLFEQHTA